MPNHIHLVIEPTIAGSLPKIMMRLTLAYSSYAFGAGDPLIEVLIDVDPYHLKLGETLEELTPFSFHFK